MNTDELFEFEECDSGYILKSYLLKTDPSVTELEIPSEHRGLPIIGIGFEAFLYANHLCSVKIGEGIEEIGIRAFYSCENLKTVVLPDSLRVIQRFSFNDCGKLENILFPTGLEVINEHAFHSCKSITSITFPSALTKLGKGAFCSCSGLKSAVFPKELENIGALAFSDCTRLNSVVLPEKLKTVRDRLFFCCCNLENIELPNGLEEIGEFAFYHCGLRTVELPAGLKKIGLRTFSHCENLEKVDFGNGSPFMAYEIFERCLKLSAENVIQGLACSADITKPFPKECLFEWDSAEWDSALREDVFALALKYNSFALFNKEKLLRKILQKKHFSLFPIMENADWQFSKELINKLLDKLDKNSDIAYRAWLLNYKNRHFGFKK